MKFLSKISDENPAQEKTITENDQTRIANGLNAAKRKSQRIISDFS